MSDASPRGRPPSHARRAPAPRIRGRTGPAAATVGILSLRRRHGRERLGAIAPGTGARVSGGSSGIRRRIIQRYNFHPIRDRELIRRWLPKLYVAYCRREGLPWVYQLLCGYVPAMLLTEHGCPTDYEPWNGPDLIKIIMLGTERKWTCHTVSPSAGEDSGNRGHGAERAREIEHDSGVDHGAKLGG